jgi:hypothetical protein
MPPLPSPSLLWHIEEGPHPPPHLHRPHLLQAAGLGGRGRVESQHGAAACRGGQDRPQVGGGAEGLGGGRQAESVAQATGKLTLQWGTSRLRRYREAGWSVKR